MQPTESAVPKGNDPHAVDAAAHTADFARDTGEESATPFGTVDHVDAAPAATADFAPGATADYVPPAAGATASYVSTGQASKVAAAVKRVDIPGYELIGVLGRGGMGVVYKARQTKADRFVAVKLMLNADHADSSARERFDTEAQSVARLQHPNIVQVFEVGEVDGSPFFSLEFVPGGSLSRRIKEAMLPPREAAQLVATLGRAIAYAHQSNIIHRDLKPDNVLLAADGTPKVADFGLARKLEADSRVTRAGHIFGTPSYMPPEQTAGDLQAVGPAADIYSLGAILYELLTGRPPFVGANLWETIEQVRTAEPVAPRALRPTAPRDLETICMKCLHKDPAKRYESAAALADDLQRYLDGVPILARPIHPVERTLRWCRRNPWPTALMATLVLALAASTAAAFYIREQGRISDGRLSVYRDSVDTFVNNIPTLGDNVPLAGEVRRETLELVNRMLVDAQGKAAVGPANEHGMIALELRKADLASARHDYARAEEALQAASQLAEDALRNDPRERDKATGNLATILFEQSRLQFKQGRLEEAVALLEKGIALRRQVADTPATGEILPAQARSELARALLFLSEVLRAQGKFPQALQAIDEADACLANADAGTLPPRKAEQLARIRADAALERARVLTRFEKTAEVRAAYARGIALLRAMIDSTKPTVTARLNFAVAATEVGDWLLIYARDPGEAMKYYREAQTQYRAVLSLPDVLSLQQGGEALGYYRLGTAADRAGDRKAARDFFQRCLALREKRVRDLEEAGDGRDKDASRRAELNNAKIERMLAQARCGLATEVVATADRMTKIASSLDKKHPEYYRVPQLYLMAGCAYSILVGTLPADSPERSPLFAKSADAVRNAWTHGYRDRQFLNTDPDLDAVRPTTVFQAFLADLKKAD